LQIANNADKFIAGTCSLFADTSCTLYHAGLSNSLHG